LKGAQKCRSSFFVEEECVVSKRCDCAYCFHCCFAGKCCIYLLCLFLDWIGEIQKNAPEGTKIVLVGNKSDMTEKRMVQQKEAQEFADKNNLKYVETRYRTFFSQTRNDRLRLLMWCLSAKDGTNVDEAFVTLASQCLDVV
jgi:hypothetical protein